MRAMILAAGFGSRLRPLTRTTPKALVPVAGRPLIEYSLLLLKSYEIEEVVINLHHLGHRIRDAIGDGSAYGLRITYSPEDPILESGGGIKKAQPFLDGDTFLVFNCDTIIDLDLNALLTVHRQTQATGTLVLRSDPNATQYGIVEVDTSNRLCRIRGEPADTDVHEPLSQYMFTGCQVLEPRVFDFMPELKPFSSTRETYPAMLRAGEPLYGFVHAGVWMTVDDAEAMARATQQIVSGEIQLSYLRP
ncbi:MAG: NDP-sugar synthase [Candidatus Binatia bacterium]